MPAQHYFDNIVPFVLESNDMSHVEVSSPLSLPIYETDLCLEKWSDKRVLVDCNPTFLQFVSWHPVVR